MADVRIGTSSFTATGWQGWFYPKGLRPADYLSYYAQHFDAQPEVIRALEGYLAEKGGIH